MAFAQDRRATRRAHKPAVRAIADGACPNAWLHDFTADTVSHPNDGFDYRYFQRRLFAHCGQQRQFDPAFLQLHFAGATT